jgi:hypothetical protein
MKKTYFSGVSATLVTAIMFLMIGSPSSFVLTATTASADGSTVAPGSGGTLTTSAGAWNLGTATASGGNIIPLNARHASFGYAVLPQWTGTTWNNIAGDPRGGGSDPPPTNGVCGAATGITTDIAPMSNLHRAGTASALSRDSSWTRTSAGTGDTASCQAYAPASCALGNHGSVRGWAHVANGTLLADDGCLLRGSYPNNNPAQLSTYQDYRDNGHYNYVRVSAYLGSWYEARSGARSIQDNEHDLDQIIAFALQTGLYVMIDFHNAVPPQGCPVWGDDYAFWTAVAPRYANYTNVIYQIQNEPDYCSAKNYQDIAQHEDALYRLIRSYAPNTPIAAWTFLNPVWVNSGGNNILTVLSKAPGIDYSNAVVDFHPYAASADQISYFVNTARGSGYPVMSSEYGHCYGQDWNMVLSTLESLGVSWSCGDGYPDINPAAVITWPQD